MAKEGDHVEEFDPICEVQSDKATVEITSRFSGRITQLSHKVGDIVKVGHPLCFIQKAGGLLGEGADVQVEYSSAQVSDGAGTSAPSPSPGTSSAPSVPAPPPLQPTEPQPERNQAPAPATAASHFRSSGDGQDILATPAVRRLSRDHSVDLANVEGTGKEGRITKEDVLRFLDKGGVERAGSSSASGSAVQNSQRIGSGGAPASAEAGAEADSVPLDGVRRAMFKAMSNTLRIPHFAYSEEIDVTALEEVRKTITKATAFSAKAKDDGSSKPTKLTLLPLLVKALSLALHEHPLFLSTLELPKLDATDPAKPGALVQQQANGARLRRRTSHDISIALSSPTGLLTPLLRSVESRTVTELAVQIADLQARAASSSTTGAGGQGLTPADFGAGGTITLSNIGAMGGGTYTHPLIPPTGQLAIGALGRTRALPRFASECPADGLGEIEIASSSSVATGPTAAADRILRRLIMPVSFTGDHRVVEGAEMARLVRRWKMLVEQPSLWLSLLK